MKIKNLSSFAVVSLLLSLAVPASAVAPYTNTFNSFTVSVDTTANWTATNSNNLDRMLFTVDRSVPVTISFVISATDNGGAVNLSNYECVFQTGASTFASTNSGLTLAKTASSAQSITCDLGWSANFPITFTEFKISPSGNLNGSAVTGRIGLAFASQASSGSGGSGGSTPRPAAAKYEGPEILAIDTLRPIVSGEKLTFTGKNLSAVSSATIGSVAATLSYDAKTGLSVATPPVLAPGKYDLVMQSSYGKLTHINAVTIKAPTPTATLGFRSDAQHLNEKQVLDLVAFNQTLNPDYEKVRCIVNASDPKTAKRIADLVCAQVARGEARNVEVIKELRNTYSGEGFWVRVYAAG